MILRAFDDVMRPDLMLLFKNYTSIGFKKVQAPKAVFELLSSYWEKHYDRREEEKWPRGNTYVNHWAAPTYMVNVEEPILF